MLTTRIKANFFIREKAKPPELQKRIKNTVIGFGQFTSDRKLTQPYEHRLHSK
jgi:hypothetical protein